MLHSQLLPGISHTSILGIPAVVQWVKDLELSLQPLGSLAQHSGVNDPELPQLWYRSQLWLGFDPWAGNFRMPQVQPKKKKKKSIFIYQRSWVRGSVGESLQMTAGLGCPFQLALVMDIFPPVGEFWPGHWGL